MGEVKYTGKYAMSMPEFDWYPDGEVPLCAGTLRDGINGYGNKDRCKLDCSKPNKWSKPKKTMILTFVIKTLSMICNSDVVSGKWLGLQYTRTPVDKASVESPPYIISQCLLGLNNPHSPICITSHSN